MAASWHHHRGLVSLIGFLRCRHCAHEWAAVWPEPADALECPGCGQWTGISPAPVPLGGLRIKPEGLTFHG